MTRRKKESQNGTNPSKNASAADTSSPSPSQTENPQPQESSSSSPNSAEAPVAQEQPVEAQAPQPRTESAGEQAPAETQETHLPGIIQSVLEYVDITKPAQAPGTIPEPAPGPSPPAQPKPAPEPAPEPEEDDDEDEVDRITQFRYFLGEYWDKQVYGKTWTWQIILSFGSVLPFIWFMDAFLFIVSLGGDMAYADWAFKLNLAWIASFLIPLGLCTGIASDSYTPDEKDRIDITSGLSVTQEANGKVHIWGNDGGNVVITKSEMRLLISHRKVRKFAGIHDPVPDLIDIKVDETTSQELPGATKGSVKSASTIERASPL